jgi:Uma2 family endonuclease
VNAPVVPKAKMTVPEFLAWAETQPRGRFELVDGVVVAMSPERVRHAVVKLEVVLALREAIRDANLPCAVLTDGPAVVINNHKTREPDASVQCGIDLDLDSMVLQAPLIVVEVVSPTSERRDSGVKLADYFSVASIQHHLLVYPEPDTRLVVHHRRNESRIDTRIARPGEDIALDPPGFSVPVVALLGPSSIPGKEVPQ